MTRDSNVEISLIRCKGKDWYAIREKTGEYWHKGKCFLPLSLDMLHKFYHKTISTLMKDIQAYFKYDELIVTIKDYHE